MSTRHESLPSVTIHHGAPPDAAPLHALVVDVGSAVPTAFEGLRAVLTALEQAAPAVARAAWVGKDAEYNFLFPFQQRGTADLFDLADAPNQRRLFRESEQVFRVLNASAHVILQVASRLRGPLVLRNTGACDLPSLRGLMHAVECARLWGVPVTLQLCEFSSVVSLHSPPGYRTTTPHTT